MKRWNWVCTVIALVAFAGGWLVCEFGPVIGKHPHSAVVRVLPVESVYVDRPVVRTSLVDRIVYRRVPPDTVRISEPGRVDTLVQSFCAGTTAADTTTRDSIRPQLVLTAGRVQDRRLELYGFTNTGRAYTAIWPQRPPYEFTTDGDSVVLQARRIRWELPGLVKISACVLTGAAAGYLLGR